MLLDPNASMALAIAYCVPRELDRLAPGVTDLADFVVEEAVPAVSSHEQKKATMNDVVQIGEAGSFTAGALLARSRDAVLRDLVSHRPTAALFRREHFQQRRTSTRAEDTARPPV